MRGFERMGGWVDGWLGGGGGGGGGGSIMISLISSEDNYYRVHTRKVGVFLMTRKTPSAVFAF